jgi:hypothetical protein
MFIDRRLPATLEAGPHVYQEFINHYGTHYFSHGKYGGLLLYRMTTDINVFQQLGERKVKAEAQGNFFNFLKANGAYTGATHRVDSRFSSKTSVTTRYICSVIQSHTDMKSLFIGCFKNVPVRLLGTRFEARNCISEPCPQEPNRDILNVFFVLLTVTTYFFRFSN